MKKQLKPFPSLRSDKQAEDFVANADLTEYDFSGFRPAHYEFKKKEADAESERPERSAPALKRRHCAAFYFCFNGRLSVPSLNAGSYSSVSINRNEEK